MLAELVKMPLPAVELFAKNNWPLPAAATKFCATGELFVIPAPLKNRIKLGLAVIV